ncbi:amidohydrolase family protein [Rhodopseudomonas sp. HC1]|uniref:amidohydrolase family protein n=1 Tax=Rhodopseudomonas infernalis TaxID=2897386 RepID=UPI001EE878E5|nr:amidohydrolase family protein [Rhodopseudomonas infernalis]MCG6205359.1 amidohydrolase family protein [Rhodopseudomonas infernalis]
MTRTAIQHGLVLTMDGADRIIEDGLVVIEGRDIVAVETYTAAAAASCDTVIDATGRIVLPGLVNSHTHLCMTFGRTIGPERRLLEWLDLIMPMMAAMDEDALYVAELLGCVENIKNGNTSLVENIFMPPQASSDVEDAAFRAMRDSGIRGTVARATEARAFDPRFCETAAEQASRVARLAGRWHGAERGRLRLSIGPLLPWVLDEAGFRITRRIARDNGLALHMHVAESPEFNRIIAQHFGRDIRQVELLEEVGCLGPDVQAIACSDVSPHEIELLAASNTAVLFDPPTRLFWGTGFPPIREFLTAGITCGLATNGAAANCGQDIFESMKYACATAKTAANDPEALTAARALRMATVEGARAIGQPDTGSIEIGKRADLITLEARQPHLSPLFDPQKALVYSARGADVRDVVIDGTLVMRDRKVQTVDEDELLAEVDQVARRCAARSGITLPDARIIRESHHA